MEMMNRRRGQRKFDEWKKKVQLNERREILYRLMKNEWMKERMDHVGIEIYPQIFIQVVCLIFYK